MTKLTVPIITETLDAALTDIRNAQAGGADLVEIRLDYLGCVDYPILVSNCNLPILWTLRHVSEGGKFTGSIDEQIDRLATALAAGGEYVDIEFHRWISAGLPRQKLQNVIAQRRGAGKSVKLILSHHDFTAVPDNFKSIAETIAADPHCDVVKLAVKALSPLDLFPVLDFLHDSSKPAIGIAMGPYGEASRLLAGKFNAEITFAALGLDKSSAPGQMTLGEMKNEFQADRITPATKLAAVLGHPIGHSLSPIMHNRAYRRAGLDAVYLKFDLPDTDDIFVRFIDAVRERSWLDCLGFSVTIPHKANALNYVKARGGTLDPLAESIGAVNTLVFSPDRTLAGYNTDLVGIRQTLHHSAGLDLAALRHKRVSVLGAGGVTRAILAVLTQAGAEVTVFNRTAEKAHTLAREFRCRWDDWDRRNDVPADLVVNGTSLGMYPNVDDSPLAPPALQPGMVVFDTIYNPLETKLLRFARSAGARGVNGVDMLVFQAIEQINLWFRGQNEDFSFLADIMKDAVLSKLR